MPEHFLVTRFNLKSKEWQHTKNGEEVLTDRWLKERFRLFDNYCFPSVKNQTNQYFKWCVFFDSGTPDVYKKKMEDLAASYHNFHPIYIDGMENLTSSFISFIESNLNPKSKLVITTRLDNDDIIHKDFIEIIQNEFPLIPNTVIDLRKGYQISIEGNSTQIRGIDFPFNQFLSYVELAELPIKTVMHQMHREWKNNSLIKVFTEMELWVELIHDSNKVNAIRGNFKRVYDFNNGDFGLSSNVFIKENLMGVFFTNLLIDLKKIKYEIIKKLNFLKGI